MYHKLLGKQTPRRVKIHPLINVQSESGVQKIGLAGRGGAAGGWGYGSRTEDTGSRGREGSAGEAGASQQGMVPWESRQETGFERDGAIFWVTCSQVVS